LAIKVLTLLT